MNIEAMINEYLKQQGCVVTIDAVTGITTVKTPDNEMWDFTRPAKLIAYLDNNKVYRHVN
jgi:hypothetical protein